MKKILLTLVVMAGIFGGTFAAWRYGVVAGAWNGAVELAGKVLGRGTAAETATAEPDAEAAPARRETLSAMTPPQAAGASPSRPGTTAPGAAPAPTSLRPPSGATGAADAASLAAGIPQDFQARSVADNPPQAARSQPVTQPQQQPQPQARATGTGAAAPTATAAPQAARQTAAGPNMAPVPVLSDVKSRIRVVDQLLASDPAEAMRRIDDVLAMRLEPDDAAEAGYRKGYAARMLRDEATAERAWRETADKYPTLRGGRYSAMALGDTLYHKYAGERTQVGYWDDISILYSRALGKDDAPFLPDQAKAEMKRKLNRINDSVLFGSAPTKLARYHKVESGELLGSIAGKYRVDYESIARVNGINPDRIRVGMDLKLVVGDIDIIVRKNEADPEKNPTVTWFVDGRWAREYPACVGDGIKTPAGTYNLTSKERDPSWTNPVNGQLLLNNHPENILGSRWMAMKGMNTQGLGIHGTTVDDSVPGYTSAGCIRLLNKDVEELFSYARIGGRITVLD